MCCCVSTVASPPARPQLTREFAETMGLRLQQYLSMVSAAAERDVGRCGPLSHAFNSTRDAACRALLMPTVSYTMCGYRSNFELFEI